MSAVLIYSDRDELGWALLAWAARLRASLGPPLALVLGEAAGERAQAYLSYGAERIYINADPALDSLQDDIITQALFQVVEESGASLILIGATRRGRSFAPRLAQRLAAGCVNEAVELNLQEGRLIAGRYALGGNTISRQVVHTQRQVISVLPGTVERGAPGEATGEIVSLPLSLGPTRAKVVERRPKPPVAVDISESERLVCVGRGLASQDDLQMVAELAEALGGELACTRPLSYEYDWLPGDSMIGISGQKCSPRLLFSLGVSGQVQHTVGIMGAKTIVAVNNDPNAPIFTLADYGLVGDLYEIVPRLVERLRERKM